jgi:hypothetical protein
LAVLIPSDLRRAPGISTGDVYAGAALEAAMPDDAWIWYNSPRHSDLPRFVALSPSRGVVGIDVYDWSPIDVDVRGGKVVVAGTSADPAAQLARRLEDLRGMVASFETRPRIAGLIFLTNFREDELEPFLDSRYIDRRWLLTREDLTAGRLSELVPALPHELDDGVLLGLRDVLYPDTNFDKPRLVQDEDGARRAQVRIHLDAQQEDIARSLGDEVTIVTGPSGSGKSLVLAARARLIASQQPDWSVQILCYNRALISYLSTLVGGHDNIHLATVFSWLRSTAGSIDPEDDRAVRSALNRGIEPVCDAMLIDEGQDFAPSWLEVAIASVRANRAGVVVATDQAQCIYREVAMAQASAGAAGLRIVSLNTNYRSTMQIGLFALGSVFGTEGDQTSGATSRRPANPTFVSSGPKVQLVYANSWNAQADFIAEAIEWLVGARRAAYRDIAILFPQNRGIVPRLIPRLEQREIPYFWINRDAEAKASVDLTQNSVKVSTAHSCKGMEFSVVFLFGIEALDVVTDIEGADVEHANRARVGYVAMTRAQDLLFLTYTRPNAIIDRALDLHDWAETKVYPTDFRAGESISWHG